MKTDRLEDPCPKLQALGRGNPHVVTESPHQVGDRLKARCRYCSRSIDLAPAERPDVHLGDELWCRTGGTVAKGTVVMRATKGDLDRVLLRLTVNGKTFEQFHDTSDVWRSPQMELGL